jgi:hypothetical protein
LGAVADGKVVVSVIVNGLESSTIMRFPALRQIERNLPDLIVRKMTEHSATFLPERLREVVTDLWWEGAGQVDSDSRKLRVESVRDTEASRVRKRLGPAERDGDELADRQTKKRAEWSAKIVRVMRAIKREELPITKAEVARRLNLGSERTRTQAVKKILDRNKLKWEQLEKQVNRK